MANRSPNKIMRECDAILSGELSQTEEQFRRWTVAQIKKLAGSSAARKVEHWQLQQKVVGVERFSKGGL